MNQSEKSQKSVLASPWAWSIFWMPHFESTLGDLVIRVTAFVDNEEYGLEYAVDKNITNPGLPLGGEKIRPIRPIDEPEIQEIIAPFKDKIEHGKNSLTHYFSKAYARAIHRALGADDSLVYKEQE